MNGTKFNKRYKLRSNFRRNKKTKHKRNLGKMNKNKEEKTEDENIRIWSLEKGEEKGDVEK
ncbi:hypothetical protein SESBI_08991 [Sesbania bispinosa]|nr:hypothetical protein SESBI_08991 [Sesbania bispinosa]